ncbi:radical SAM protein [Candidatus Woesearchaeota archaeon]|nr:radical SAM protein [Candidatus Woesearchaeota archaeon]
MRVLFVNPSWEYIEKKGKRYNRLWPPLSLLYCATDAKQKGHDVIIFDLNAEPDKIKELLNIANSFDFIFLTSSSLDRWQCPNLDIKPVESVLEKLPQGKVYLIGVHGTVMPEYFLKKFKIKAVIMAEPEETVREIISGKSMKDIQGIAYLKNGKLVQNQRRQPINLSELPVPDYSLLPFKKYYYELMGGNFMLFETSRGCPFKCIYCYQEMFHNTYRKKPFEKVKEEIQTAVEKFNVRTGYLIDLELTVNKNGVNELCDFLIGKKYDFRWCCQTRADTVTEELLTKMKKAGCTLVHYGIETGSPAIMELINKKTTLEKIEKGIRMTNKSGMETAGFFMFGFPGETEEDMQKTIDFAKEINPTYVSFHTASIYPNTKLFTMVGGRLKLPFDEAYTKEHSLEKLKKMERKAFVQFYLRPRYILTRLFTFNINSLWKQFKLFLEFVR